MYYGGRVSNVKKADTVIVLGAAQQNGTPLPMFKARLDRAEELYRKGYASSIIVTGGKSAETEVSDASVAQAYLVHNSIAADDVFIEERSRTTLENLMFSQEIMRKNRLESALLVSHDFHLMRAQQMAKGLGMTTASVPVQTKSSLTKLNYATREVIVYIAYFLFNI